MKLAVLAAALIGSAPLAAADPATPDWTGRWVGTLENLPLRPGAPQISVVREIDGWPAKSGECRTWRTRYFEGEAEKGVKDYRMCRGDGDRLYVDEGDGVTLDGKLLGDVFASTFKYNDVLLMVTTRVRGDQMIEEIFTARDKPAIQGPLSLETRSLQRLVLTRE